MSACQGSSNPRCSPLGPCEWHQAQRDAIWRASQSLINRLVQDCITGTDWTVNVSRARELIEAEMFCAVRDIRP